MKTKKLVKLSAVAALYIVFTLLIQPFAYKNIQFRISEVLVLLVFFNKDYRYSIILGCFISNLFSPLGIIDLLFGVGQTLIAVMIIGNLKNLFLSAMIPVVTMPIIALELYIALDLPFILTCITTMLGEVVVTVVIGYPLFRMLRGNKAFLEFIEANRNLED